MAMIENENVVAYWNEENLLVKLNANNELPQNVPFDKILTTRMIEDTETVYFDDLTGEQIF
jgi:hypothetical protein